MRVLNLVYILSLVFNQEFNGIYYADFWSPFSPLFFSYGYLYFQMSATTVALLCLLSSLKYICGIPLQKSEKILELES